MKSMMDWELGPIRPPSEAFSVLFRLSRNCPWNQCGFCNLYKGSKFQLRPSEEVIADVDRARAFYGDERHDVVSVFLQDADAMMRPTDDMVKILDKIRETFPNLKRVTSYGRAAALARRKPRELERLKDAGLDRVHVGLESGDDETLKRIRKGIDARQSIQAGLNVREAGMELSEYIMPGLGGVQGSGRHAQETARVLNQINPDFIRVRSLSLRPKTPLYEQWIEGEFKLLDEEGIVREIRDLVQGLEGIDSVVISDHILNLLQEVEGKLPEEKHEVLNPLNAFLALAPEEKMDFIVGRRLGAYYGLQDRSDPTAVDQARLLRHELESRIAGTGLSPEGAIRKIMERVI